MCYQQLAKQVFIEAPYLFQTKIGKGGERAQAFQSKAERAAKNTQLPDSRGFTPGYKDYAPSGLSLKRIFEELLFIDFKCITGEIYTV